MQHLAENARWDAQRQRKSAAGEKPPVDAEARRDEAEETGGEHVEEPEPVAVVKVGEDDQRAGVPLAVAHTHHQPAEPEKAAPTLSFYQRTNPHKPSALASLHGCAPRRYTVSIALPGSIILNAQSPELQSRLAGQLARSCAIFNVDEIVVFNEGEEGQGMHAQPQHNGAESQEGGENRFDPNAFLARILQYVETPQYLRKQLFPMHRDLRMAGILAPLDCPHHLRYEEESPYREGVCVEAPHWANDSNATWIYTGFKEPIQCVVKGKTGAAAVPLGARVTVKMPVGGKKSESGGRRHATGIAHVRPVCATSWPHCQPARASARKGPLLGLYSSPVQLALRGRQCTLLERAV